MPERSCTSPGSRWLQFSSAIKILGAKVERDLRPVVDGLFVPVYRVPEAAIAASDAFYDKWLARINSPGFTIATEEECEELIALLEAFVNEIAPGYFATRASQQGEPEGMVLFFVENPKISI
jgi:hypothetical protein